MSRPVITVAALTLCALVWTSVCPPMRAHLRGVRRDSKAGLEAADRFKHTPSDEIPDEFKGPPWVFTPQPWNPHGAWWTARPRWLWNREPKGAPGWPPASMYLIEWRLLFLEQAIVLLVGGGLTAWFVRRKRRANAGT